MKDRSRQCPECSSKLLARQGDKIICLNYNCHWSIDARREEDKDIPTLGILKKDWS